jgi:uncharacterized protein
MSMAADRFARYELRTIDQAAARAFYDEVFGADLWRPCISIAPLPERAVAMGAPPHWLGHIGVNDVEATANKFMEKGAQRLGPTRPGVNGVSVAAMRDSFGAVMGLSSERAASDPSPVAWHLMISKDEARAFACYAELFGWSANETADLGAEGGKHQLFAWEPAGNAVGAMTDLARSPGIHTQWLFFFRVADIERARDKVRALGGFALPPMTRAGGNVVAPCDDPQGAAFGLYQPA